MGAVKGVVTYACELLDMSLEEALELTIQELTDRIEQTESAIVKAQELQELASCSQEWDVDCDENGPFICIAEDKGGS
jgi:hypothetical protein